jgi:hypothetical protein
MREAGTGDSSQRVPVAACGTAVSRASRPDGFFGTEHVTERPTGAVPDIHGAALSWLIEGRSVDGVRRPATVGFLLVAPGLAACHFVDCLAEAECLAGGPGERDWIGTERGACFS